jgi:hypothetical protein
MNGLLFSQPAPVISMMQAPMRLSERFRNRLLVVGSQPSIVKALAIDFELAGSVGP